MPPTDDIYIDEQVSWMVEVRAVHYLLAVAAPGATWTAGDRPEIPRGATLEVNRICCVCSPSSASDPKS